MKRWQGWNTKVVWSLCLSLVLGLFIVGVIRIEAKDNTTPAVEGIDSRWVNVLQKLVDENSSTDNVAGSEKNREIMIQEFDKLGFKSTVKEGTQGRKVVSFQKAGAKPELALIGHVDTVFPKDSSFDKLKVEGNRLSGPGVIDMKGGLVMMLNIVDELNRTDPELAGKIRVIINDDEETGSVGTNAILKDLTKDLKYGLVLEPGLPDGSLVTSHMGVRWLQVDVHGKASHAGLEPQSGIDACTEASYKTTKLSRITDYKKGPFVNPGVIQGGTKPNVVCENATIKMDIRFFGKKDLDRATKRIKKITDHSTVYNKKLKQGTKSELKQLAELPPMTESSTADLFKFAQEAGKELGQSVTGKQVGYGSDANHLAPTGLKLLVGLGPYGGGMHTNNEFMDAANYEKRLKLNLSLIGKVLKK
ncbi:glutamate carboxypeptidase [Marininema mesophilum]|uniref:Glutamate carboxypeptidase n=1 Tax=Marininema mesophilum TaxID=1048340 RepID=A0A1H2W9S6_9BACL|nr:M20/M25/M40 family metallo-hydrolase [Marininema mesophilum]SDW77278.1 glutamate carboxypeptidase [Marininema mesophilum]